MIIIPRRTTPIKPTAREAYFDKVQFWVRTPLNDATLGELRSECGRGGLYVENRPARFDARYRQRLELKQPNRTTMEWIARRDDALINGAEVAVDYVFKSSADRDDAWEFLDRHLVRSWHHGKNQKISIVKSHSDTDDNRSSGTRYDAGRSAPNGIVLYKENHSRMTDEVNCLHLEWRLKGLKAVRRAGIKSGQDLLEFSHRQFWQKRLRLYDVDDRRRLGRLITNRAKGKKSRASKIEQTGRYRVNIDGRTGEVHVRSCDTIQELLDKLRGIRSHRALVAISNEFLLPE
jgi:hypothetical protein